LCHFLLYDCARPVFGVMTFKCDDVQESCVFQAEIYTTKTETESVKVFYTEIQQRLSDEIRIRHDSAMQALVRLAPSVVAFYFVQTAMDPIAALVIERVDVSHHAHVCVHFAGRPCSVRLRAPRCQGVQMLHQHLTPEQ
jgi:hypothetical protein